MKHEFICSAAEAARLLNAALPEQCNAVEQLYPVQITPYYLNLIDRVNPSGDPVWKQCMPDAGELLDPDASFDPLAEETQMPVSRVIHRFADRIVLTGFPVTTTGANVNATAESRDVVRALNAAGCRASFVEIETDKGHDAFFLDEPHCERGREGRSRTTGRGGEVVLDVGVESAGACGCKSCQVDWWTMGKGPR